MLVYARLRADDDGVVGVLVLLQAQRLSVDGAFDLLALAVELLQFLVVLLPVAGGDLGKLGLKEVQPIGAEDAPSPRRRLPMSQRIIRSSTDPERASPQRTSLGRTIWALETALPVGTWTVDPRVDISAVKAD